MMLCKVLPFWLLLTLCLAHILYCSPIPKSNTTDEKAENDNNIKNGENTTNAEQHAGEIGKNATKIKIEDQKPKNAQESGALEPGATDKAKSGKNATKVNIEDQKPKNAQESGALEKGATDKAKSGKNATKINIEDEKPKNAQESGALEPGATDKAKSGTDVKQEGKEKDKKPPKTTNEKGKEGKMKEKETKKSQIPKKENGKEKIKKDEVVNAADIFNQMYEPFNIVGAENTPAALLSISGLKIENGKILSSNVDVFKGV